MNADFIYLSISLVLVGIGVRLAENDDAVVSHVSEVRSKRLLDLFFALFSDLFFTVGVLSDYLGQ